MSDYNMILNRFMYLAAITLCIILGLTSRKYGSILYPFIAQNAGDVLWAMMVYFGFRFLFVQKGLVTAIILSLLFSFGIEFSQLYQSEWINQFRNTTLGALALGKGFLLIDLLRYTTGILLAALVDLLKIKKLETR